MFRVNSNNYNEIQEIIERKNLAHKKITHGQIFSIALLLIGTAVFTGLYLANVGNLRTALDVKVLLAGGTDTKRLSFVIGGIVGSTALIALWITVHNGKHAYEIRGLEREKTRLLQEERDTAVQERDTAVQGRKSALLELQAAIQVRDAATRALDIHNASNFELRDAQNKELDLLRQAQDNLVQAHQRSRENREYGGFAIVEQDLDPVNALVAQGIYEHQRALEIRYGGDQVMQQLQGKLEAKEKEIQKLERLLAAMPPMPTRKDRAHHMHAAEDDSRYWQDYDEEVEMNAAAFSPDSQEDWKQGIPIEDFQSEGRFGIKPPYLTWHLQRSSPPQRSRSFFSEDKKDPE